MGELHSELLRRHRQGGGAGRRVRVGKGEHYLEGLEIFAARNQTFTRLHALLLEFEDLYARKPPIDGPSADALKDISDRANEAAKRCEDWVRDTTAFTTEANLRLALAAIPNVADPKLEKTAGGWRVGYFGCGLPVVLPELRDL